MAVNIIVNHHRSSGEMDTAASDAIDEDDDGKISVQELMKGLPKVNVRADYMLEVMELETNLVEMMLKLPNFLVCLACFLFAIIEFSPPGNLHSIHERLQTHFQLDELQQVSDFNGVYDYMGTFVRRNEEMQATSFRYWCEQRYAVHSWNEHLGVPVHDCPSPRLYALQLVADKSMAWSVNGSGGGGGGSPRASGVLSTGGSSGSAFLGSTPPCVDDEAQLQQLFKSPSATCLAWALDPGHHICQDAGGLSLCPKTCGFCSPFEYDRLKRFERPQVTILPVIIYQTRFVQAPCHGFAVTYDQQAYNGVLKLLPALDGKKDGSVLECIDRSKAQDKPYAFELDCPPDAPSASCPNGKMGVTKMHTFHGDPIYPKLLAEPLRDIRRLRELEWIDLQSDTVSLSVMIYTEGVEVFTSLTVNFVMDEAGNVDGKVKIMSYREMLGKHRAWFVGCLLTCMVGALIGVILSIWTMLRYPIEGKARLLGYELFSRLLFVVYPAVFLIQWSGMKSMAEEFDHLLHSFLDIKDVSEAQLDTGIQSYFDTKTHIYSEIQWMTRHRLVAYLVCYVQFVQLILYFNAHPKLAVITTTVQRAMDNIGHFLVLFLVLYVMLAYMAHWMLGPYLPAFGTMSEALKSQVQMVYGDFIQVDKVESLSSMFTLIYWIYAGTVLLLVIWVLMNFFLAIIVDAFVEVKEHNAKMAVTRDFFTDTAGVLWTKFLTWRYGWPVRHELLKFFREQVALAEESLKRQGRDSRSTKSDFMQRLQSSLDHANQHGRFGDEHEAAYTDIEQIMLTFTDGLGDKRNVAMFLLHYYHKCKQILALKNANNTDLTKQSTRASSRAFSRNFTPKLDGSQPPSEDRYKPSEESTLSPAD